MMSQQALNASQTASYQQDSNEHNKGSNEWVILSQKGFPSLLKHDTMICFPVNMGAATCSTFLHSKGKKIIETAWKEKSKQHLLETLFHVITTGLNHPGLNHPASQKAFTYKRMRSVYIWSRLYSSKIICLIHIQHKRQKKKRRPLHFLSILPREP